MARRRRIAALAIVGLLWGCDSEREAQAPTVTATAPVVATDAAGTSSAAAPGAAAPNSTVDRGTSFGRTPLAGFGEVAIRIRNVLGEVVEACTLLAADVSSRQQGLIGVSDPNLGGYDGMLFQFDEASTGTFHMRDVPIPLSIAFFDDGQFVSATDMAPCPQADDSCARYPAAGPFTQALEVPQGRLETLGVGEGTELETGGACPPPR